MRSNGAPLKKRYKLPAGCNCREFIMRELQNRDSIEAGIWADRNASAADSDRGRLAAELVESVRLSLVEVDGKRMQPGMPFMEMDNWSQRTMRFLLEAYQELNGVQEEELGNFMATAELVEDKPSSDPAVAHTAKP